MFLQKQQKLLILDIASANNFFDAYPVGPNSPNGECDASQYGNIVRSQRELYAWGTVNNSAGSDSGVNVPLRLYICVRGQVNPDSSRMPGNGSAGVTTFNPRTGENSQQYPIVTTTFNGNYYWRPYAEYEATQITSDLN